MAYRPLQIIHADIFFLNKKNTIGYIKIINSFLSDKKIIDNNQCPKINRNSSDQLKI